MEQKKDEPKIHVDDDWKAQAQAEKERLAKEEASAEQSKESAERGPLPEPSFALLVVSLAAQVRMCLGDIENPADGKEAVDLQLAKHNIDLLGMLEGKTQGNLSEQEKKLLDSVLYELRMRYVQLA